MYGRVKWYSETRGYGFVRGEDKEEYFLHYRAFPGGHIAAGELLPGRKITFEPGFDDYGRPRAITAELVVS